MPEMTFRIPGHQADRARKWVDEHPCNVRKSKRQGAIGGRTTFTFTDTSIGQIQAVKCACGEEHLISDDL